MTISQPIDLHDILDRMGFAFCAIFSFHKHPIAAHMNLDFEFSRIIHFHLKANVGCMIPLLCHDIREDDVLISLHLKALICVKTQELV